MLGFRNENSYTNNQYNQILYEQDGKYVGNLYQKNLGQYLSGIQLEQSLGSRQKLNAHERENWPRMFNESSKVFSERNYCS